MGNSQTLVTTTPQYKKAILEELTGLHCTYCPDGHVKADQLKANNPGRVILINIHAGPYAVPNTGEPDMRTPEGTNIDALANPSGYPAGSINREQFPASDNNTAMGRSAWADAAAVMFTQVSPVNIGAQTSYNSSTRELTIDVEAYYTSNSPQSMNFLNIALIQDSILGPQTGGTTYNPSNYVNGQYVHSKVLRDMITGQWGDTIYNTTQGSLFTKQYTYTLPTSINSLNLDPNNCRVAIFITETKEDIYTGVELTLDGDSDDGSSVAYYGGFGTVNPTVLAGTQNDTSTFNLTFTPAVNNPMDWVFNLTTDAPNDWTGFYAVNGTNYTSSQTITINNGSSSSVDINVIPGATGAVSKYTLTMYPTTDTANKTIQEVYVISGITDLIVNGSGSWGDGGTYNWDQIYLDGLNYAGNTSYDITSAYVFKEAEANNALNGVNNIYLNIGWTFPSFADDEATAIMNFMNAGGNVFVAGQDMGWDIMSGQGYGTAVTQNLFTNYFHASYVADGGSANNQLVANSADAVFGTVANSPVVDAYNGNFYPDEINPASGAMNIFSYSNGKSCGVRYENGTYKVVYMGIGMEMVQNTTVKDDIIKWSHDWFYGLVSTEEFDAFAKADVQLFPNPNKGQFQLNINEQDNYTLTVYNSIGEIVIQEKVNTKNVNINMENQPNGVYMVTLVSADKNFSTKFVKQ
ncbi:MAG: hypothetical protein Kow0079_01730 [Vicingaceae bacterium]